METEHRPVPGRLYRVMKCPDSHNDHIKLLAFEGPARIYGTEFIFNWKEGFFLCLPHRKDLPDCDMFLVSGTINTVVWYGLTTKPRQDWLWLEEVSVEEEEEE